MGVILTSAKCRPQTRPRRRADVASTRQNPAPENGDGELDQKGFALNQLSRAPPPPAAGIVVRGTTRRSFTIILVKQHCDLHRHFGP